MSHLDIRLPLIACCLSFSKSLAVVSLTSAFRSITDPNGATYHSFIGRKGAQGDTEKGVGGLLQRAKGAGKKHHTEMKWHLSKINLFCHDV